jgi:hypothetical protein
MNNDRLAKSYATLTPAERWSLIMAASARGDEQECHRLATAAPSVTYQAPHHFALATAFRELCASHRLKVLDLAGWYLYGYSSAQATDGEERERLLDVALWFGYMLRVNLAGWQLFCAGQHLDPDPFLVHLPGKEMLDWATRLTQERDVFTAEEALACMHRHDLPATAAPTAEEVAAGLEKSLAFLVNWWS